MRYDFWDEEYRSPECSIVRLDAEADVCVGTNTPGAGDYDDEGDPMEV